MTVTTSAPTRNLPANLALYHALALIVFLSWRFGGMESLGRTVAGAAVTLSPIVTLLAWRQADASLRRNFLRITLPLAGIAVLISVSLFNPNMRLLESDGAPVGLIRRDDFIHYLPSTAWPRYTVGNFLLNAGLILTGLNLFLARPSRSQQRALLAVVGGNAAMLACVGSVFKLTHATRIFDVVPSTNPNFFASFVYYNHWGAFALLGATAAAALALQYRHTPGEEWQQTPAPFLGVLVLLLLLTLPLSGARASIAAGLVLAIYLAIRLVPGRTGSSGRGRVAAALVTICVLMAGTAWLARDKVSFLFRKTAGQLTSMQGGGIGDARLPIYRETWDLFRQQPVFGWGWHSYRYVYRSVQTHEFKQQNEQREKSVVLDAHNDWLQLLTELGVVGAILAISSLIGVARVAPFRTWRKSPSLDLAAGVASVGLLAFVDFPFACPVVVVTAWALLATGAAVAFDRSHTVASG